MAMATAMRLPAAHSGAASASDCLCYARSAAASWQGPASTSFSGVQLPRLSKRQIPGEMKRVSHRVRASAAGTAGDGSSSSSIVPVKLESPVGQFLVSLLESHPHLFSTAAEQQIQELAAEKEKEAAIEASKTSGTDLVLYKRIAEVKQRERQQAVVELIYALVVDKYLATGARLVPKIAESSDQRVDYGWTLNERELESIHTPEALEVMKEHLELTLGSPSTNSLEQHTMVRASKFRVGHMYAGTIVFGYFLKRLDQRYQLQAMLTSDNETPSIEANVDGVSKEMDFTPDAEGLKLAAELSAVAAQRAAQAAATGRGQQSNFGIFPSFKSNSKLKKYAMSLDQETVQMLATLRTKESLEVVERQTQALFGKPEVQIQPDGSVMLANQDDPFVLSLSGLRKLVLEALAFGTFLWEAESHVDQNYNLMS